MTDEVREMIEEEKANDNVENISDIQPKMGEQRYGRDKYKQTKS